MTASEIIPITSEAQWLGERAKDVTGTEVPALYGLSPYLTAFELWHGKHSGTATPFAEDERVRWGKRLESAIAQGVAEDAGWTVRKLDAYMRQQDVRLGASFDFEIVEPDGPAVLEVKNVDRAVFFDEWSSCGDGAIAAPPHIEIQLQTQLEVSGRPWGCIVVLVGGNEPHVLMRQRDRDAGQDIRARVAQFWRDIAAGNEPKPDFERDAEFIRLLKRQADPGSEVDADSDHELSALLARLDAAKTMAKQNERNVDAIESEILMRIDRASKVRSQLGTLSCGTVKASAGRLITEADIGQHIGARAAHRQIRWTPKKQRNPE